MNAILIFALLFGSASEIQHGGRWRPFRPDCPDCRPGPGPNAPHPPLNPKQPVEPAPAPEEIPPPPDVNVDSATKPIIDSKWKEAVMDRLSKLEAKPSVGPGATAKDGKNGVDGKPGRDGVDGKSGADGKPGPQGPPGKDADPAIIQKMTSVAESQAQEIAGLKAQLAAHETRIAALESAVAALKNNSIRVVVSPKQILSMR